MGANMSILAWVGQALGLIPQAIEAGKQVAQAVKPAVVINPDDSLLWHTVTYREYSGTLMLMQGHCTVCGRAIPVGFANQLCSEAVRRRNAGIA